MSCVWQLGLGWTCLIALVSLERSSSQWERSAAVARPAQMAETHTHTLAFLCNFLHSYIGRTVSCCKHIFSLSLSQSLYDEAKQQVSGPVEYRHSFVDFSKVQLNVSGQAVHTCPAAMGEAFAAGTTDGPGAFDFKQGASSPQGLPPPMCIIILKF